MDKEQLRLELQRRLSEKKSKQVTVPPSVGDKYAANGLSDEAHFKMVMEDPGAWTGARL